MSNGNEFASKSPNRIYVTGDCDGLPDLRDTLAAHPEVELVGSATTVAEAAATLTGGHLNVVLHATRAGSLPVNELAAIREYTRAPLILLASNGSPVRTVSRRIRPRRSHAPVRRLVHRRRFDRVRSSRQR